MMFSVAQQFFVFSNLWFIRMLNNRFSDISTYKKSYNYFFIVSKICWRSSKCPFSIIRSVSSITRHCKWDQSERQLSASADVIKAQSRPGVAITISGTYFNIRSCFWNERPPTIDATCEMWKKWLEVFLA